MSAVVRLQTETVDLEARTGLKSPCHEKKSGGVADGRGRGEVEVATTASGEAVVAMGGGSSGWRSNGGG